MERRTAIISASVISASVLAASVTTALATGVFESPPTGEAAELAGSSAMASRHTTGAPSSPAPEVVTVFVDETQTPSAPPGSSPPTAVVARSPVPGALVIAPGTAGGGPEAALDDTDRDPDDRGDDSHDRHRRDDQDDEDDDLDDSKGEDDDDDEDDEGAEADDNKGTDGDRDDYRERDGDDDD